MRSIFRTILVLASLLVLFSCSKLLDPLYISIPNTNWCYEKDNQRAFVHFGTNEKASIVQRRSTDGVVQFLNGTFSVDGHAVDILSDEGSSNRLVRTFSHLKNSSNKNLSRFGTQDYANLTNTVWVNIRKDVFRLYYFKADGKVMQARFDNVTHQEGVPYGWFLSESDYSQAGSNVSMGTESGFLFSEVMLVDDTWFMHFPVNEDSGSSALTGSIWTYETGGYPGLIIFDTNSSFTRVLLASRIICQVSRGTYSQSDNVVTLTLDGKTEDCIIADDQFTFLEKKFRLFE